MPAHIAIDTGKFILQRLVDEFLALGMTFDHFAELGENASIDAISLRKLPHRTSKVSRLPWIDHCHGVSGGLQYASYCHFQPACRFEHDQRNPVARQFLKQGIEAIRRVGDTQRRCLDANRHIQRSLGNVNANGNRFRIWQARHYPSLYMRTFFKQLFGLLMSGSARAPFAILRAANPRCHQAARALPNRHKTKAVDLWTMRLRRTGKLTVDNAARCPPRSPSSTSYTASNYE
jgi:hypothetical protein